LTYTWHPGNELSGVSAIDYRLYSIIARPRTTMYGTVHSLWPRYETQSTAVAQRAASAGLSESDEWYWRLCYRLTVAAAAAAAIAADYSPRVCAAPVVQQLSMIKLFTMMTKSPFLQLCRSSGS